MLEELPTMFSHSFLGQTHASLRLSHFSSAKSDDDDDDDGGGILIAKFWFRYFVCTSLFLQVCEENEM